MGEILFVSMIFFSKIGEYTVVLLVRLDRKGVDVEFEIMVVINTANFSDYFCTLSSI